MNLIQAFSSYKPRRGGELLNCWIVKLLSCWFVDMLICWLTAEYWPLTIISGFQPFRVMVMRVIRYPNANFANGCKSTQITAFVIPNVVRNLASNALGVRPSGLGRWADGTASRAKENQAVRSEASFLIFRHASVAKACEAHEALTFWLLLGQAKSDKKEILRFALNDKLIVNC